MSLTPPKCPHCSARYVVLAVTIEQPSSVARIWACKSCGKSFTVSSHAWWHIPLTVGIVATAVALALRRRSIQRVKGRRDFSPALPDAV